MTEKFAKLFEDDEIGQILIFKDTDDEGCPVLAIKFDYGEYGYVTYKCGFKDNENEDAYSKLDMAFEKADKKFALKVIKAVKER